MESRVPADVPFGVFLSGGVDSSLVAVLAARRRGGGFPTFSLRFPDRGYDESAFARDVAALIGSVHHELTMDVAAGREAIERVARGMEQTPGEPSRCTGCATVTWWCAGRRRRTGASSAERAARGRCRTEPAKRWPR